MVNDYRRGGDKVMVIGFMAKQRTAHHLYYLPKKQIRFTEGTCGLFPSVNENRVATVDWKEVFRGEDGAWSPEREVGTSS